MTVVGLVAVIATIVGSFAAELTVRCCNAGLLEQAKSVVEIYIC